MLKHWDTPFASTLLPNVEVVIGGNLGAVTLRVSADRSWEVRFTDVVALKVAEEEWDDNRRFALQQEPNAAKVCSYRWDSSPWLNEIDQVRWEQIFSRQLSHFVLLGADHNVEVLATEPQISLRQYSGKPE